MSIVGVVDGYSKGHIRGWVWDSAEPNRAQMLEVLLNGEKVAEALAGQFRADLKAQGMGEGNCAYEIPFRLPQGLKKAQLAVRIKGTPLLLTGSPLTLECPQEIPYKHALGACLCFKDSARYLEEWLLFHRVQGVEHFYLYNNESSDNWRRVVEPWVRQGLATCVDFPGIAAQTAIYDDCLGKARGVTRWLAMIDDDEFLFSSTGEPLLPLLETYAEHAGVAASWVCFGSSGREEDGNEWVTERFGRSCCAPDQHIKCIVRPERVKRSLVVGHQFETDPNYAMVDEQGRELNGPLNAQASIERLRINHYLIKSWAELRVRRARPSADNGKVKPHPEAKWREWDEWWSSRQDNSAVQFHERMRATARELKLPGY